MAFVRYESSRDPERAAKLLEDALARNPDSVALLRTVTAFDLSRGESERALTRLDRALEARPEVPLLLALRAQALVNAGRLEEAERDARQAFERNPSMPGVLDLILTIYERQGRVDVAIEQLEASESAGLLGPNHRVLLGRLQLRNGNPDSRSGAVRSRSRRGSRSRRRQERPRVLARPGGTRSGSSSPARSGGATGARHGPAGNRHAGLRHAAPGAGGSRGRAVRGSAPHGRGSGRGHGGASLSHGAGTAGPRTGRGGGRAPRTGAFHRSGVRGCSGRRTAARGGPGRLEPERRTGFIGEADTGMGRAFPTPSQETSSPAASLPPWFFPATAAAVIALHAILLFASPGLHGGADLLPHLRMVELMGLEPALRNVYPPAYHVIGALIAPLVGLSVYPKLFAVGASRALDRMFPFLPAAGRPSRPHLGAVRPLALRLRALLVHAKERGGRVRTRLSRPRPADGAAPRLARPGRRRDVLGAHARRAASRLLRRRRRAGAAGRSRALRAGAGSSGRGSADRHPPGGGLLSATGPALRARATTCTSRGFEAPSTVGLSS